MAISALAASPAAILLAAALIAAGLGTTVAANAAAASTVCTAGTAAVGTDLGDGEKLDAGQLGNARTIYQVGAQLGIPQRGEVVALATAIQESRLVNLTVATNYDSLGLFQQRPSQGWGTAAQLTDPVYASTKFYQALQQVPNWQNLPVTVAAQDVQHSGAPDAYAQWEPAADTLTATFAGTSSSCATSDGDGQSTTTGTTTLPGGYTLPAGTPTAVVTAISYAVAQLGKPYVWGGTGPAGYDCSGLVMQAYLAAGITLPRTTYQQVYSGTAVYNAASLKPGDLVFTAGSDGTATNPGHVGIYLGDDLVLDAPHTGAVIQVTRFDAGYWNTSAVAFRRIAG
jgi:cell wall-associated NlpC family hydrolase